MRRSQPPQSGSPNVSWAGSRAAALCSSAPGRWHASRRSGIPAPTLVDLVGDSRPEIVAALPGGRVYAVSPTGRRLWSRKLSSPDFGCATAAGEAVFTTTYTGHVYAFAQDTGRTLWTTQEPAGINGCPAVAGNLLVVPAGAEPSTMSTPTPVIDGYETGPA